MLNDEPCVDSRRRVSLCHVHAPGCACGRATHHLDNLVNVTVTDTVLQKTAGWDGVDDAGATSLQELTAGDGYIEFTVGEATTFLLAGLSHGNDGTGYADIDFAFRFNGAGWADVLENGVYAGGDTPYSGGDVFRVAVVGGRVQYSRNGLLLRESANVPQYPLLLDTSLGSMGATVRDAVLGVSPPPPPGGGFIETAGSPALRPRLTGSRYRPCSRLAGARGVFTFPAPYNTTGIRLTNDSDCAGGQDCLWYAGYSYWRNINNHAGSADLYIFLGTDRNRGGVGPVSFITARSPTRCSRSDRSSTRRTRSVTAPAKAGTSARPSRRRSTHFSSASRNCGATTSPPARFTACLADPCSTSSPSAAEPCSLDADLEAVLRR